MPLRTRTVSAQILIAMLAALAATGLAGFALASRSARTQADRGTEQRALAIAAATAATPSVIQAVQSARGGSTPAAALSRAQAARRVEPLAATVQQRTGAAYVVVIDRAGYRYSHPDQTLVGQQITEPVVALDGRGHVGIDDGNLGRSANGRAPIFSPDGQPVGEVSVGVLEHTVSAQAWSQVMTLGAYSVVALLVGVLIAIVLARRLKRQTFGLELDEIARLLQEREATLHGIHEGVVAVDPDGRISLINDTACVLLAVTPTATGQPVDRLFGPGRVADLLTGRLSGIDQVVLVGDHLVVVNRKPVHVRGTDLGAVVTLRDRTEIEQALRELDDVRSFTDALRAQQHEYANRMHAVAGLLELGHTDEALGYLQELTGGTADLAAGLDERISSPLLVALLTAKQTVALERGVRLTVSGDSRLEVDDERAPALVSIIGNLVDNAIDASVGSAHAEVSVRISQDDRTDVIEVADTGPGIPAHARELVFTDGWSTKPAADDRRRGLGLALVAQLTRRFGGRASVSDGPGAVLRVEIPRAPVTVDG